MKPEIENQLKQLVRTLPAKQQTFDFAHSKLWEQLSAADQRACRNVIAALLRHVALAQQHNDEKQENHDHA